MGRTITAGALILCLGLLAAPVVIAGPKVPVKPPQPVHLELQGDNLKYTPDRKSAVLSGNVQIRVTAPGFSQTTAVIHADQVEVSGAKITSAGGTRILLGPAILVGDGLQFDAERQDMELHNPQGYMLMPTGECREPEFMPTLYFKGQELRKQGQVAYILRAQLSTCDKEDPHYVVSAKRVKFSLGESEMMIYDASLRLYGMKIPLLPWWKTSYGARGEKPKLRLNAPGYSKRDGVYIPYQFRITSLDEPWQVRTALRITQRQGVVGTVWGDRSLGDWDYEFTLSRHEWVTDKLTDKLRLDKLPEAQITRNLTDRADGDSMLQVSANLGDFKEQLRTRSPEQPVRPEVHESRVLGTVSYLQNRCEYENRTGQWYGSTARLAAYTDGRRYADLELFAGMGGQLTGDLSAYATLKHHVTGGETPFLFDDVDIKTELLSGAAWDFTDNWGLEGWGRYDLDASESRDYEVTLVRRAHCLTWGLFYRDVGDTIGLRVDVTGLTGRTRPVKSESVLQRQMAQEGLCVTPPDVLTRPGLLSTATPPTCNRAPGPKYP